MPLFNLSACGDRPRPSLLVSLLLLLWFDTPACFSQTETSAASIAAPRRAPQEFTSKNFVLHTDLPEAEAQQVLERLETTLAQISRYWGRRPRQQVECYVVDDLKNWSDTDFPHGLAHALIGGVGGGVFSELHSRKRAEVKSTVYSSARPGVAEHESVHAYCCQTFGSTGPSWYKEGMAEMAFHARTGQPGVECDTTVIDYLRRSPRRTIGQITDSTLMNQRLLDSLHKLVRASGSDTFEQRDKKIRQWGRDHADTVRVSRESYRWCWALCHFLSRNPNYAKRFQQLGRGYLTRNMWDAQQPDLFPKLLGSMHREIEFEYHFFLDRIDVGYRVDLCHWDWKSKFRTLDAGNSKSSRIKAAFGYQPSGLHVQKHCEYSFECDGTWQIEGEGSDLNANGNERGLGRLEGVIMSGYKLSEPFELGHRGSFKAPAGGKLYLRCRDRWTELADNNGSVMVKITNPATPAAP